MGLTTKETKMKDIFTETVRAYIYRVLIALGSVALVWGLVTGEQLAAILGAVAAVLNIMPAMNTSTKSDDAS
jgi:hypothetical protein